MSASGSDDLGNELKITSEDTHKAASCRVQRNSRGQCLQHRIPPRSNDAFSIPYSHTLPYQLDSRCSGESAVQSLDQGHTYRLGLGFTACWACMYPGTNAFPFCDLLQNTPTYRPLSFHAPFSNSFDPILLFCCSDPRDRVLYLIPSIAFDNFQQSLPQRVADAALSRLSLRSRLQGPNHVISASTKTSHFPDPREPCI